MYLFLCFRPIAIVTYFPMLQLRPFPLNDFYDDLLKNSGRILRLQTVETKVFSSAHAQSQIFWTIMVKNAYGDLLYILLSLKITIPVVS